MQDTSSLYDFAKECPRMSGVVHDDYIVFPTQWPAITMHQLQAWGDDNGYKIKASQVNNSVIVEVVV